MALNRNNVEYFGFTFPTTTEIGYAILNPGKATGTSTTVAQGLSLAFRSLDSHALLMRYDMKSVPLTTLVHEVNHAEHLFIASVSDAVAGWGSLFRYPTQASTCEIAFAVTPCYRRMGIGTGLILSLYDYCVADRSTSSLVAKVRQDNVPTNKLMRSRFAQSLLKIEDDWHNNQFTYTLKV